MPMRSTVTFREPHIATENQVTYHAMLNFFFLLVCCYPYLSLEKKQVRALTERKTLGKYMFKKAVI